MLRSGRSWTGLATEGCKAWSLKPMCCFVPPSEGECRCSGEGGGTSVRSHVGPAGACRAEAPVAAGEVAQRRPEGRQRGPPGRVGAPADIIEGVRDASSQSGESAEGIEASISTPTCRHHAMHSVPEALLPGCKGMSCSKRWNGCRISQTATLRWLPTSTNCGRRTKSYKIVSAASSSRSKHCSSRRLS